MKLAPPIKHSFANWASRVIKNTRPYEHLCSNVRICFLQFNVEISACSRWPWCEVDVGAEASERALELAVGARRILL